MKPSYQSVLVVSLLALFQQAYAGDFSIVKITSNKGKVVVKVKSKSALTAGDIIGTSSACTYKVTSLRGKQATAVLEKCNKLSKVSKRTQLNLIDFADSNSADVSSVKTSANKINLPATDRAFRKMDKSMSVGIGINFNTNNKYSGDNMKIDTKSALNIRSTTGKINDKNFGYMGGLTLSLGGEYKSVETDIVSNPEVWADQSALMMNLDWNGVYEFLPSNIAYAGINYPFLLSSTYLDLDGAIGFQVGYMYRIFDELVLDARYEMINMTARVNNNSASEVSVSKNGLVVGVSYFY